MKKILLTLGTTTIIATPLVTVVACGSSSTVSDFHPTFDETTKELTVERTTYVDKSGFESTITEQTVKKFLADLHNIIKVEAYKDATKLTLTKSSDETKKNTITVSDITFDIGSTSTYTNVNTLDELLKLEWKIATNAFVAGKLINLTATENMMWQLFIGEKTTIVDDTAIRTALTAETFESTKTREQLEAVASETAVSAEEANTKFGVTSIEFKKITDALGSDWEFLNLGYNTSQSKLKLVYRHKEEQSNKEIELATNPTTLDDSSIRTALDALNITSTKTFTELISVAGVPATSEEEANTGFGIVKAEFDPIITALGGETSDWKFVNIDFDTMNLKFKLSYKHSSESINREINLTVTPEAEDDSAIIIELNKLNIASTKTLRELTNAAGTPATSEEEADTRFGIVKAEFDSIITSLGGVSSDWKFANIDFNTTESKFKLTYKHLHEQNNREIDLIVTPELEDDSAIIIELNKLNITSTKTITGLNVAAGTPATTEEDANIRFGIVKAEFDSIITALGGIASDWKFVNIDFDSTSLKFKLSYKHTSESTNREINLTTIAEPHDDAVIIIELNKLNIASTKPIAELNGAAGTPATTEEDANTRFGIVKTEFDSIITHLGGVSSHWKFVSIDFDTTESKFKLIYKHSLESTNREINLTTIPGLEDDSAIVIELNKLNITTTKTFAELTVAGIHGTPATTEEEANTKLGIVKAQFDSIITALGGNESDWKFVNIHFNTTTSKFKLTYKHSSEQVNRENDLAFTLGLKDDSAIVSELNKLVITTTKTLEELIATIGGIPATSETDANTKFGIVKAEFDKIITALGGNESDWKFVNIDFESTTSKFRLYYKHVNEQAINRQINLTINFK